ncbi:MAG: hypothetical protein ACU836_05445 [Gammaproteobacteria bacterium]
MERNYRVAIPKLSHPDELHWRTAFHEAGHAAAIHILNRKKQLPPVYFEIQVKRPEESRVSFLAKVIDGKLIQNLSIAVPGCVSSLTESAQHHYQRAYEADIVNLLVGPLSEAKYVALNDGEVFNKDLVSLNALRNYGGHSDLESVQQYLDAFVKADTHREQKINELFREAQRFIDDPSYWQCISELADFILKSGKETISCEETTDVLECSLLATDHRRLTR